MSPEPRHEPLHDARPDRPPTPDGQRDQPAPAPQQELLEQMAAVLDGNATADQRAALDRMLARDAEARRLWRRYVNLHVGLRTRFANPGAERSEVLSGPGAERSEALIEVGRDPQGSGSGAPTAPAPPCEEGEAHTAPPTHGFRRWRPVVATLAVAAAIALVVGLALKMREAPEPPGNRHYDAAPDRNPMSPPPSVALGRVTRVAGAVWADGRAPSVGDVVHVGTWHLERGLAEVTLITGVRLLLDAPVKVRADRPGLASLEVGRLVAFVPESAHGFTVDTPRARVVDLGTEFGVGVGESGDTEVHVFQGAVVTAWSTSDGRRSDDRLAEGKAVRIDAGAAPRDIPWEPHRFVRNFPTDVDGGQPAGPLYSRSRHDTVHVLPAPGPVVPDGDLAEWDRSGAFRAACQPPFHESHTLDGMMMYDAGALYLAARVGDPAPLRSRMDPTADKRDFAWRGGSVVVRLSTDPALGWPLKGLGRQEGGGGLSPIGKRPEDTADGIVHVTLWHHQPTGRSRVQLAFGMDFHDDTFDPAGCRGTMKRNPDGLGYTLEYVLPWKALRAARPPRAGDVLAANWTVHWSDADGRLSRGYLTEITNIDDQPYRFLRARTWGRAVYHETGPLPPGTVRARDDAAPK